MSATYIGELTIGEAVPGCDVAVEAGIAGINGALPDIESRLAALAGFSPQPFSFAAQLAQAQSIVASIQFAITAALPAPSFSDQIATIVALMAQLHAQVLAINAQLSIVVGIQGALLTGGVFAYASANQAQLVGADLSTSLAAGLPGGNPTDACNALLLITSTPATWDVMRAIFKVTP